MSARKPMAGVGVWSTGLRLAPALQAAEAASYAERLGYTAAWLPGRDLPPTPSVEVFERVGAVLAATEKITVGTAIVSIWNHEPQDVAAAHRALNAAHGGRFLLGLGVSHAVVVDGADAGRYRKPVARMGEFLDALDATPDSEPDDRRVLAALGPRMLDLARDRTAGTHPYLTSPGHTAKARERLGAHRLVAPAVVAAMDDDYDRALAVARKLVVETYLPLENYRKSWMREGFTERDFENGGSESFVTSVVAVGSPSQVTARIREHQAAGADHVAVQFITAQPADIPLQSWESLASAMSVSEVAP